jgi:hypothetical protein
MQPEEDVPFDRGVGGIPEEGERCVEGGNRSLTKESTTLAVLRGENGMLREEDEGLRA